MPSQRVPTLLDTGYISLRIGRMPESSPGDIG